MLCFIAILIFENFKNCQSKLCWWFYTLLLIVSVFLWMTQVGMRYWFSSFYLFIGVVVVPFRILINVIVFSSCYVIQSFYSNLLCCYFWLVTFSADVVVVFVVNVCEAGCFIFSIMQIMYCAILCVAIEIFWIECKIRAPGTIINMIFICCCFCCCCCCIYFDILTNVVVYLVVPF